jgi:putative ABC transport system permease protein
MNYLILRIAFRNLRKQRKFSILNIFGLSIGFAFINLIALFVMREISYDRFHKKANSIYRMEIKLKNEDGTIQNSGKITIAQTEALKANLPGLATITFLNYSYFDWDQGAWLTFNGKSFQLQRVAFTNAAFSDVFSFPVIAGNLKEALNDPYALVITQENAINIFGSQNPVGKDVLLNNHPVTIKAVIDSKTLCSSIPFSALIDSRAALYFTGHSIEDYSNMPFFEVNPKTNIQTLEEAGKKLILEDLPPEQRNSLTNKIDVHFFPLTESYFKKGEPFEALRHGNQFLVGVILSIGILILILAVVNYINLSFAGSFKKHKELAVRSISGAGRKSLILQFLFDGIFISVISAVLSLFLSSFFLPWFNRLIDFPLAAREFSNPGFLLFFPILVIATGLISGIFPALWTTQVNPINLIKGISQNTNKFTVRKYLVVFQMFISTALIIGTLTIARQINFVRTKDLGFRVNNVVTIPVHKLGEKKDVFLQTIKNNSQTEACTLSSTYLNTFNEWGGSLKENGQEKDISYFVIQADADFLNTTGIRLSEGRNFEKRNTSDNNACLINETAITRIGITNPLSATISGRPIIGVVKDFHIQSLYYKVGSVVILNAPENKTGMASIQFLAYNSHQIAAYLSFLKTSWEDLSPSQPFEYEFLDQRLKGMYEKDERLMKVFSSFSILSILIACLGLFGLILFISETKIKEIGIRKINGAKVSEIMFMLNKDFIKWLIVAFVIATPVAWYAMHKWLENFAYKTTLSWWIFALAGLLALGIALLTVSWQSWRAATRNPVEALRYE